MILDLQALHKKYNLQLNGVLHIGANNGGEYNTYKLLAIEPIIMIEALPHIFEELKQNVGEECTLIQTAIGNIEGNIEMYVETGTKNGSSSVLKPKVHLQQYPHIHFDSLVNVPITKVDSLDIPKVNFINIDIQGYELEALKGAKDYLQSVDYIMCEVNKEELYEGCARVEEIDTYLTSYGFERVETDWAGWSWGDAFYIKKK